MACASRLTDSLLRAIGIHYDGVAWRRLDPTSGQWKRMSPRRAVQIYEERFEGKTPQRTLRPRTRRTPEDVIDVGDINDL